jgi:hypothetical protein
MNDKKQVDLSLEELKDAANFHKETMESFAKHTHKYNNGKTFEIFAVSIGITISNTISSLGIEDIDYFLEDLMIMIKKIHKDVKENSLYMEFKKGKKISEGRFN